MMIKEKAEYLNILRVKNLKNNYRAIVIVQKLIQLNKRILSNSKKKSKGFYSSSDCYGKWKCLESITVNCIKIA